MSYLKKFEANKGTTEAGSAKESLEELNKAKQNYKPLWQKKKNKPKPAQSDIIKTN